MKSDKSSRSHSGPWERSLLSISLPLWAAAQFAQFLGCLFFIELALAALGKEPHIFSANPWFPLLGATFYVTCAVAIAVFRVRRLRRL